MNDAGPSQQHNPDCAGKPDTQADCCPGGEAVLPGLPRRHEWSGSVRLRLTGLSPPARQPIPRQAHAGEPPGSSLSRRTAPDSQAQAESRTDPRPVPPVSARRWDRLRGRGLCALPVPSVGRPGKGREAEADPQATGALETAGRAPQAFSQSPYAEAHYSRGSDVRWLRWVQALPWAGSRQNRAQTARMPPNRDAFWLDFQSTSWMNWWRTWRRRWYPCC
jgi:hypothetical protein